MFGDESLITTLNFFIVLMFTTGVYMLALGLIMKTNDFTSMILFKVFPGIVGVVWLIFGFKTIGML